MARQLLGYGLTICVWVASVSIAAAVTPSEKVFPDTTAGWLSIPDKATLDAKWNETQLGQMFDDAAMKPFVEDLRKQLKDKLGKTGVKLGVSWEELETIYGGEVAVAVIQPKLNPADRLELQHAVALYVNATGKEKELAVLLKKINDGQKAKGSKVAIAKIAGVDATEIVLAKKEAVTLSDRIYYVVVDQQLVMSDHKTVFTGLINQLKKPAVGGTLADAAAYKAAMDPVTKAGGDEKPQLRWFIDPFRNADVARAMTGKRKRGIDPIKVLRAQGFDAVKSLAGTVSLKTSDYDIVYRGYIHAPADPKAKPGDKYRLGMRMLNFPNGKLDPVPDWIPTDSTGYGTVNLKMRDAAEKYIGTVVDAFADGEVYDELLSSLATDPKGPMVDLKKNLFPHLGERAIIIGDMKAPVDINSKQSAIAIEIKDEKAVAALIKKMMDADKDVKAVKHGDHIIWEMMQDKKDDGKDEEAKIEIDEVKIDGGGDIPVAVEAAPAPAKKKLPNSAVCVYKGHLLIGTHVDHIAKLIDAKGQKLDAESDYSRMQMSLEKLGGPEFALRYFVRLDTSLHTTYELIRTNKMPEGETLLAKLLNRLLAEEGAEDGEIRKVEIDGSKLPDYALMKKYLGPAGLQFTSEKEGWSFSGCILKKQ